MGLVTYVPSIWFFVITGETTFVRLSIINSDICPSGASFPPPPSSIPLSSLKVADPSSGESSSEEASLSTISTCLTSSEAGDAVEGEGEDEGRGKVHLSFRRPISLTAFIRPTISKTRIMRTRSRSCFAVLSTSSSSSSALSFCFSGSEGDF